MAPLLTYLHFQPVSRMAKFLPTGAMAIFFRFTRKVLKVLLPNTNYRTISLTSVCSKIMEHIIYSAILRTAVVKVTGQLADTPTHGLDISRTGQLTDWSTRALDNSSTSQLAGWTSHGLDNSRSVDAAKRTKTKHSVSPVASASCPVRDLSGTRVV